jgi:hypothetical protein
MNALNNINTSSKINTPNNIDTKKMVGHRRIHVTIATKVGQHY